MPLGPLLHRFNGNTKALAEAAGVSRRTVQRWCEYGLPYIKADRVCCKVKECPPHVWLDWHLDDDEIVQAVSAIFRLTFTHLGGR